ncbi:cation transporter, partial [Streptomyces albidoflavus]|uniref:cation transporter n=1 Tax=Streptomyces albidoflavus TaxID=1886 RepID=UPI00117E0BFA
MTCASCAARVEKKLNRMPGVTATVNYATEKAKVAYEPGEALGGADLIAPVVRPGYPAGAVRPPEPGPAAAAPAAGAGASGRPRRAGAGTVRAPV